MLQFIKKLSRETQKKKGGKRASEESDHTKIKDNLAETFISFVICRYEYIRVSYTSMIYIRNSRLFEWTDVGML